MSQWHGTAAVRWLLAAAGYACVLAVAVAVIVTAGTQLTTAWTQQATPAPEPARSTPIQHAPPVLVTAAQPAHVQRTASMVPTSDEWADKLRDPAFWRKLSTGRSSVASPLPKSFLGAPFPPASAERGWTRRSHSDDDTYRTVCVRLCDGAFFPLSFATTRDRFEADAARCETTCAGGRLYAYRNPGGSLDDLEDQQGQAYRKLPTAYLYKTKHDPSCKCRAHPWEEAARSQHRVYALEDQRARGDKAAAIELADLKARIKLAEQDAAAAKNQVELEKAQAQKQLAEAAKAAKAKARQVAVGGPTGQRDDIEVRAAFVSATLPAIKPVQWGQKHAQWQSRPLPANERARPMTIVARTLPQSARPSPQLLR